MSVHSPFRLLRPAGVALVALLAVTYVGCGKKKEDPKPIKANLTAPPALGSPAPTPVEGRYTKEVVAGMNWDDKLNAVNQVKNKTKIALDQKNQVEANAFQEDTDTLYDALIKESDTFPPKDRRAFDLMNEVAYHHYQVTHNTAKALELFEKMAKKREASFGSDDPELANDLNKLGNVYSFLGKDADAEASFKKALEVIKRQPGGDHPYKTMIITDYGVFLRKLKRDADADALAK